MPQLIPDESPPTSRTQRQLSLLVEAGMSSIQRHSTPAPKRATFRSNATRSVNRTQRADERNDEIDFRTTSRPMPAGSPAVIPMVACMKNVRASVDFLVLVFFVHVFDVVL